ncbi:MAG: DUF4214 domain-containing protein [Candidatus Humimicrobiaceae bacterium]
MFKAISGISKKILIISIAALFLVSMILFISPSKAYGATLTVGPGETYTTIQTAIDAASAGDTITVKAGTYNEAIIVNKAITLLGAQAGADARTRTGSESVIDPNAPDGGASKSWVIKVTSSNVTIDGFTVQNPTLNYGSSGLLYVDAGSSYYENLFFRNNILQNPGIKTSSSTDWGKFGYGIGSCKNVLVEYNYIKNILCDTATPWNGTAAIWPWNTDGLTVRYNKIENVTTFGVGLSDSNINTHIYNNDISLGNPGSAVPSVSNAGIRVGPAGNENVVIENNNISNCPGTIAQPGAGIRLQSNGSTDLKGNNITGCPIGVRITADAADISKIKVNNNSISGNLNFGLSVADGLSGGPLDAANNWWGDASGPLNTTSNPGGKGDSVSDNVNFTPWLTNPVGYVAPAPAKPLTPEEQASLDLSIEEQVAVYGASDVGLTKTLYDNILGRAADSEGLNDWVTALNEGSITLGDVVFGFVFSKELESKISPAGPEEFMTFLYKNVFDRNPDPDGFNNWVTLMQNGMTKEEVLLHFIDSGEFKSICEMFGLKP